jgi:RNA polymerase sigma factor (sigma-70 family)
LQEERRFVPNSALSATKWRFTVLAEFWGVVATSAGTILWMEEGGDRLGYMMCSDRELLRAYAESQDEVAFEELARRHGGMVYRACLRYLKNAVEAQDAAQAVFVVLVRQAGSLLGKRSLAAWLYAVARHVSLKAIRTRTSRARREEEAALLRDIGAESAPALVEELDRALAAIPETQRQAVILKYVEGHSQEDAARIAGCPVGTISKRASRGIEKLRNRLQRYGPALSVAALLAMLEGETGAAMPESFLPSVLAVSKLAAGGAVAGAAGVGTNVMVLAEGAMKAMMWTKVKQQLMVMSLVILCAIAGPYAILSVRCAEPSAKSKDVAERRTRKKQPTADRVALFPFKAGGLYGYIDRTGKVVLRPVYSHAGYFAKGLAVAGDPKTGKSGLIDRRGRFVLAPGYDRLGLPSNGFSLVGNRPLSAEATMALARRGLLRFDDLRDTNMSYGFIDLKGKYLGSEPYLNAGAFACGLARVAVQGKGGASHSYGYVNTSGKLVIPAKFRYAADFSEGLARVEKDNKLGYINTKGKWVVKPMYPVAGRGVTAGAGDFHCGRAAVLLGGKWGFIDKRGVLVVPAKYEACDSFSEGLAAVRVKGLWGYVKANGKLVVPPRFGALLSTPPAPVDRGAVEAVGVKLSGEDKPGPFSEGLAAVLIKGKVGFIDRTGRFAIEPKLAYTYAGPFRNGIAPVLSNVLKAKGDFAGNMNLIEVGRPLAGYIDKKGNFIWKANAR